MDITERARKMSETAGGRLPADDVETLLAELGRPIERLMRALIPTAQRLARPAMSGFSVGAVAQGASGALYFGANIELAGAPLSQAVHAEQATVVQAALHDEPRLQRLAVSAPPCGFCRQFLFELAAADDLEILLDGKAAKKLPEYLPGAFGPADLGLVGGLLSPPRTGLDPSSCDPPPETPAAAAALHAALRSYSPYTRSPAGVALRCADGTVFSGPYLENAAFNPSLAPLQAAAVAAALHGRGLEDAVEFVIVQRPDSPVDHAAAVEAFAARLPGGPAVHRHSAHLAPNDS